MSEEEKKPEEYIANTKISGGIAGKTILSQEPAKTENGIFSKKGPFIILVGLLLLAIAGASYYFLVYKPKIDQALEIIEEMPIIEEPIVEEVPAEASPSASEADPQIQNLENISQTDNLNQMETDLDNLDFSGFDTEVQDLKF